MPIYETIPDVFPPRVEPVNSMGDVPAFAFADGDAVAAWTPPDGFVFAEVAYRYTLKAPGWPEAFDVVARRMADPDLPGAGDGLSGAVTRNVRRLDELTTTPTGGVRFRREDGYHRESSGPPRTVDLGWFGRVEGARGYEPLHLRESWVFAGEEKAVQVEIEQDAPMQDPRLAREVLARVFAERVERTGSHGLSLWTLDVGFEMVLGSSVPYRQLAASKGAFEERQYWEDYRQAVKIDYVVVAPGESCDDAAARIRAHDLLWDREGVDADVAPTTPAHGHVLCGSAELHRPEYTWDDAMTGTSEVETAETIRVAFVALGSAHAVRITLHVGSLAEPHLEGLWEQALQRLYVTSSRGTDGVAR